MTTTAFGGGPSIEARRNFSNLKYGSQIPGYVGHIHQFKYHNGHTYGDQTHILATKSDDWRGVDKSGHKTPISDNVTFTPVDKYTLRHPLPKTTGGNRLTESMVPGYTGYVPSRKFHFSDTYRAECDQSIDDFLTARADKQRKTDDLIEKHVKSYPRHTAIATEGEIKGVLDNFKDNSVASSLQTDRRQFTEAPMPGYTGYVPRIKPTELGLGARYHETTEKGLNDFKNTYLSRSKSSNNLLSASLNLSDQQRKGSAGTSKRIFVPPGMVPKYTGYVHGRKYDFGKSYGNSTRGLPVCSHKSANFGVYMTQNPPKTAIC